MFEVRRQESTDDRGGYAKGVIDPARREGVCWRGTIDYFRTTGDFGGRYVAAEIAL